jgi:hypothetical protein
MICKLCGSSDNHCYYKDKVREYIHCNTCRLIQVPQVFEISKQDEIDRYKLHTNTDDKDGYILYLQDIVNLVRIVAPIGHILDFGAGEHAVLTELLKKEGYHADPYDPHYSSIAELPDKKYDIVILCEVIEHLRFLKNELMLIRNLLSAHGCVILRTQLYPETLDSFRKWWYIQDKTHINFFSRSSLEYVASVLGLRVIATEKKDIFVMTKDSK